MLGVSDAGGGCAVGPKVHGLALGAGTGGGVVGSVCLVVHVSLLAAQQQDSAALNIGFLGLHSGFRATFRVFAAAAAAARNACKILSGTDHCNQQNKYLALTVVEFKFQGFIL